MTRRRGPARGARTARRALLRRAAGGLLAPAVGACALAGASAAQAGGPERPPACARVPAGTPLQPLLDAAEAGSALCLEPGRHRGPLRIARRLTLWGPRSAVVTSAGTGTTVELIADGAALVGVTVDGSGGRFDLLDAAVHVEGKDIRVEGVAVRNALFGILVEKSHGALVLDNEVEGQPDKALGLRGDSIRLWEVRDSRIEGNRVRDGRDIVVWYSPGNHIAGNVVERGRYGTHFMYSHRNEVESNRYVGNVVGIFVMYSRKIGIHRNLIAESAGAAGMGLGAKESGDLDVRDNRFIGNTVGVYLDTSPLYEDERNVFEGNLFLLGDAGVVFHSSQTRNRFAGNGFRDNQTPVRVEGRGDARGVDWRGNAFDDYAGYDLDGDGIGDVPYELRSLSQDLVKREPALAFFRGAPALYLVELVGRVVPLFQAKTILVDEHPRMRMPDAGAPVAEPDPRAGASVAH